MQISCYIRISCYIIPPRHLNQYCGCTVLWVLAWQPAVPSLQKLDYERQRVYSIKVEVNNTKLDHRYSSLGPFRDTASVKITTQDVDEPPVFSLSPYVLEVREDTARGNTIGKVTAWDPDGPHHPVRWVPSDYCRHICLKRLGRILRDEKIYKKSNWFNVCL